MDVRINQGYVITDSCHVGDSEFVLGVHSTAPQQFVTWKCKDQTDYYWGHYFSTLFDAQKDLVARAQEEVQCLEEQRQNTSVYEAPDDSPGEKSRPVKSSALARIPSAQRDMAASWCVRNWRERSSEKQRGIVALWRERGSATKRIVTGR